MIGSANAMRLCLQVERAVFDVTHRNQLSIIVMERGNSNQWDLIVKEGGGEVEVVEDTIHTLLTAAPLR